VDTLTIAFLGITFWVLALANTILMLRLWGYPFDHERMASSAPRPLMLLHRLLGYAYLLIYLLLMTQMVPRLWAYQVELPARTVLHLALGIAVGALLGVKILIVRFFKHLEGGTAPTLGILLFVSTTVLIGLSAPIALREAYMSRTLTGPGTAGIERVRTLLPPVGLPKDLPVAELASAEGLRRGRGVLLTKCVACHDLRTVLAKPRPPAAWADTVRRMAERAVLDPISEREQWQVTAYLVAVSPDLQKSVQLKRNQELARPQPEPVRTPEPTKAAAPRPTAPVAAPSGPAPDMGAAKTAFEASCNGCHAASQVEKAPPRSVSETRSLVARMVDNGLFVDDKALEQIVGYLVKTYAK
jgi:mono/diheme cytochrome c family protein